MISKSKVPLHIRTVKLPTLWECRIHIRENRQCVGVSRMPFNIGLLLHGTAVPVGTTFWVMLFTASTVSNHPRPSRCSLAFRYVRFAVLGFGKYE